MRHEPCAHASGSLASLRHSVASPLDIKEGIAEDGIFLQSQMGKKEKEQICFLHDGHYYNVCFLVTWDNDIQKLFLCAEHGVLGGKDLFTLHDFHVNIINQFLFKSKIPEQQQV